MFRALARGLGMAARGAGRLALGAARGAGRLALGAARGAYRAAGWLARGGLGWRLGWAAAPVMVAGGITASGWFGAPVPPSGPPLGGWTAQPSTVQGQFSLTGGTGLGGDQNATF